MLWWFSCTIFDLNNTQGLEEGVGLREIFKRKDPIIVMKGGPKHPGLGPTINTKV